MGEEKKIPESVIGTFLMKSSAIGYPIRLIEILRDQFNQELELVLLTHSAIIYGKPADWVDDPEKIIEPVSKDNEGTNVRFDLSNCWHYRRNSLLKLEEEEGKQALHEVSGLINLKDVRVSQLSTPDVKLFFDQLIVYSDQIVGFSISSPEKTRVVRR